MKTETLDVSLSFFTCLNLRNRQIAASLLRILLHTENQFAPESFAAGNRRIPISVRNLEEIVTEWSQRDGVLMYREKDFDTEISVDTPPLSSLFRYVGIWIEEGYFESKNRRDVFLQFSQAVYDLLSPVYGKIHKSRDAIEMATVQDPQYGKTIVPVSLRKGLPGIFWANFFGPDYVDLMGRAKLLATPCHSVTELSDGGILVLTSESPLEPSSAANRARQKAARDHLGEEFFYHWRQQNPGNVPSFAHGRAAASGGCG